METKTYYAKDLSLALDQIKQELGDDAIIVKSKRVKQGGVLGIFKSSVYEVVVSYDLEDIKKRNEPKTGADNPLSGFGRAAAVADAKKKAAAVGLPIADGVAEERQIKAAIAQAQAKAAMLSSPKGVDTLQRSALFDEVNHDYGFGEAIPETEMQSFAELIKMAGAIETSSNAESIQPAWITPNAKLGAYMSMTQQPAANKISERPVHQQQAVHPQRAEFKQPGEAMRETQSNMPPNMNAPVKRGRGRPRKTEADRNVLNMPVVKNNDAINNRLDVVEQMLRTLMDDIRSNGAGGTEPAQQELPDAVTLDAEKMKLCLLNQDVDSPVADELVKSALQLHKAYGINMQAALERALREVLGKPKYLRGSTKTARTVMLVGPTGVGKTTTLVKLAAGCVFERKARVAIINADIFRVGAQDQLKAYAKILDVPIVTIYSAKDLKAAINELSDRDFVFVDTCGKASSDKNYQNEIRELLNTGKIQDTYLVVSSTTSGRVCRQIVESYSFIDTYKTILTKVDESGSVGGAVNLAFYSGQPLSYVTIGQNVPDDITKVDIEEVITQLLKER